MTDEFKDTVIVVTGAAGGVGQAVRESSGGASRS